jgi:hypothetical protein
VNSHDHLGTSEPATEPAFRVVGFVVVPLTLRSGGEDRAVDPVAPLRLHATTRAPSRPGDG